jgi:uncharacterized protein YjiS (DUF1127 family)
MTQAAEDRVTRREPDTILDRPLERWLTLVREWRTRRKIERTLGCLSDFHLRDIGLTKVDAEAACADSFDRSASRALQSAARNRNSNW